MSINNNGEKCYRNKITGWIRIIPNRGGTVFPSEDDLYVRIFSEDRAQELLKKEKQLFKMTSASVSEPGTETK